MAYVVTRLGRWFYEERGRRRAPGHADILLFHSLLCDGGMWRGQVGPLSELGRVLVFDSPGHGRSDVPPPFTLDDNASALSEVFADLGVERAVIVGLSWGGMIGMRAARLFPDRVRALALLDTSAEEVPRADRLRFRALLALARRFGVPPGLVRRELGPRMFAPRTLRERPELVVELGRTLNGFPREGTARATVAVAIERRNVVGTLATLAVPTLVLCGREDRATPPSNSQVLADAIPGARLAWIEDAGHLSAVERPGAVNDVLVPFVRDNLA